MGYRSTVAIAVCDEKRKELTGLLVKHCLLDTGITPVYKNRFLVFYEEWVRWYEDEDAGVRSVMNYLGSLDSSHYAFIRVGEDAGDVEQAGEPLEYGINYTQGINLNY